MVFLVGLEKGGVGAFPMGYVEAASQRDAQDVVVNFLIASGVPKHKIGKQVSSYGEIFVGTGRITLVSIGSFDKQMATAAVSLL